MGDHSIDKKMFQYLVIFIDFWIVNAFHHCAWDLLGFVNFPIWILQCAHKLDYVEQAGKTTQIVPIEIGKIQHREKSNTSSKQWKDQIETGIPHTFPWNYCHYFDKGAPIGAVLTNLTRNTDSHCNCFKNLDENDCKKTVCDKCIDACTTKPKI